MKPYHLYILLYLCLGNLTSVEAQEQVIGFMMGSGFSQVTAYRQTRFYENELSNYSFKVGMSYEREINSTKCIGFELLYTQVRDHWKRENIFLRDYRREGSIMIIDTIGSTNLRGNLRINYIAIPIYYKVKKKKYHFSLGLQLLTFPTSRITRHGRGKYYSGEPYESDSKTKKTDFVQFDIGPIFGISYSLSKKIEVRLDFFQGMIDINREASKYQTNRQLILGMNYWLKK